LVDFPQILPEWRCQLGLPDLLTTTRWVAAIANRSVTTEHKPRRRFMSHPYVIIGGDAAGMSAASKIKRQCPAAQVIVFERESYISYSACGMPYWIAGVVESDQALIVLTPEQARAQRGIDVRTGHEVIRIDPTAKTVEVRRRATGEILTQPYAKLLIATGAAAVKPPLPGLDRTGVFTLRSLGDARHIQQFIADHEPQRAVIIGGGYIGLEMAEALCHRNLAVTVVELVPQIMPNFDSDMVADVTAHLIAQGVQLQTATQVKAIEQDGDHLAVITHSPNADQPPQTIPADLIIVSTGVKPNRQLAEAAGLRIGETGAIWTDGQLRTSDPHIYAAGDCVEHDHLVLGQKAWIPLATSASKGGRVAGDNMAGGHATFPGIVGTAVVKVFDYTMAVTGLTEAAAKSSGRFGAQGEHVGTALISEPERAGYWPGMVEIKVKLVFDRRNGRLLGGQLAGKDGVNKRIDIIATALHARMTVLDLGWLDLSYAPPYSPTWDPVQVCANVAARQVVGE
jgi:CoA-dependent NAD(P)H sulfur oxidoreductase